MNVGIRELESNLTQYVALAAKGERVTVIDDGRPVAELVPFSGGSHIERGIDAGWVHAPRRTALGEALLFERRWSIAGVLDEDRGR